MPVAALISTDPTNGPHTAGVPFKFDASPKIGAFSSTIIHYFTAFNSLTSRDCTTFQTIALVQRKLKPFALLGATQIRTVTTNGRTIMRFVLLNQTIMRFVLLNHRTPRRPSNRTESSRSPVCCFALGGNT